ncbi:MAG: hypothetical protein JRN57_03900 [Nitrososphaerota archaeon]|nr:hypothetical protein [Nitrososphaerota archaeon]
MKPKWLGAACAVLLVAGVVSMAVPAASLASGLRMSTGRVTNIAGYAVAVPVLISNHGFLGIGDIRLRMVVLEGGTVVFSRDVGPLAIAPGGSVSFEAVLLNGTAKQPVGNLSWEVTGSAVVGGFLPVGMTVTEGRAPATAGPAVYGDAALQAGAAALAAAAASAGDEEPAVKGGRGPLRGRARAAVGVGAGALVLLVLVAGPRLAGPWVGGVASQAAGQGTTLGLSSSLADFALGAPYAAMVAVVACIEGVLKGAGLGPAAGGALKAAEGAVLALLFYLLLGGGVPTVDATVAGFAADFAVGLTLTLALFEAAAVVRAVEGTLEVLGSRRGA